LFELAKAPACVRSGCPGHIQFATLLIQRS
jgi:hypothetical protein